MTGTMSAPSVEGAEIVETVSVMNMQAMKTQNTATTPKPLTDQEVLDIANDKYNWSNGLLIQLAKEVVKWRGL
jgi:hypothetical protein